MNKPFTPKKCIQIGVRLDNVPLYSFLIALNVPFWDLFGGRFVSVPIGDVTSGVGK